MNEKQKKCNEKQDLNIWMKPSPTVAIIFLKKRIHFLKSCTKNANIKNVKNIRS